MLATKYHWRGISALNVYIFVYSLHSHAACAQMYFYLVCLMCEKRNNKTHLGRSSLYRVLHSEFGRRAVVCTIQNISNPVVVISFNTYLFASQTNNNNNNTIDDDDANIMKLYYL